MTLRRPQCERYIIKADVEGKKNNKNVTVVVAKKIEIVTKKMC